MKWAEINFEKLYAVPSKNGLNRPARVRGSGYKMINMGEIFAYNRIGNIDMELVPMNARELSTMVVEPGDLLFARQSLVLTGAGKCALVADVKEPTTFESHIIRVRLKREVADPVFYHYYFRSPICRIRSIITQGVQAGIRGSDLKNLSVHFPPIAQQHRIAAILSAYDNLIENNRRRIALLEEGARLLYREWFVHFRFPGHEYVKIIDGIPEGWEQRTFDDVCDTIGGGTPSTAKPEFWRDGDIPWFTPTDITRNSCLALLDSTTKITEAGLRASSARMLPPGAVLMTSRASVGFFGIIDTPSCTNQGFISILPIDTHASMFLLHNLMHRVDEIRAHAGGATYKEISKSRFRALTVLTPDSALLRKFEDQVSIRHLQVRTLHKMNQQLAVARNLLLPRLMNGEIAV